MRRTQAVRRALIGGTAAGWIAGVWIAGAWIAGAHAGSLTLGVWSPEKCGPEPAAPRLNSDSPDKYARSIELAKLFEKRAAEFQACLVGEANADNHAIETGLHEAQERLRRSFDALNADSNAAVAKLESGRSNSPLGFSARGGNGGASSQSRSGGSGAPGSSTFGSSGSGAPRPGATGAGSLVTPDAGSTGIGAASGF